MHLRVGFLALLILTNGVSWSHADIVNGDFESGLTGWTPNTACSSGGNASISVTDGYATMNAWAIGYGHAAPPFETALASLSQQVQVNSGDILSFDFSHDLPQWGFAMDGPEPVGATRVQRIVERVTAMLSVFWEVLAPGCCSSHRLRTSPLGRITLREFWPS